MQDLAGNAHDGEFYNTFPSGHKNNGGDLVARLDTIHNTVIAPQNLVGPPNRRTDRGAETRSVLKRRQLSR